MASGARKPTALSNGTLSLRFMQRGPVTADGNAAAPEKVTLKRAEMKDDGAWEIAEEVKEGWGMGSEPIQNVVYEDSYLPFLTPSLASTSTSTAPLPTSTGRRSFGRFNKALETKPKTEEPTKDMHPRAPSPASSVSSSHDVTEKSADPDSSAKAKKFHRPGALYSLPTKTGKGKEKAAFRTPTGSRGGAPAVHKEREADARHPPQIGFQRPKGVDVPTAGLAGDKKGKKRDREMDGGSEIGAGEEQSQSRRLKKPKKKEKEKALEFVE